jgi:HNH endonuclease
MRPERVRRFWAKVEKQHNGCWIWTAAKDGMGYGLFGTRPGRCERAHRIAWLLAYGSRPGALCVLHRCDNPACVRPDHLFLGTREDNMRDRQKKGRQARGARAGRAKLTTELVLQIRGLRAAGAEAKDLATRFGVDASTISAICLRRSWRHV